MASGLLIIAIVPILRAMTIAHINSKSIEYKTHSLILAQTKLNEIKARSVHSYDTLFTQENISLDGAYLCDVTDDSGDQVKTITVSVGYDLNDSKNLTTDEIEVILSTLIARR